MAAEDNYYDILGGYLRQGEPQQAEKAANWGIAIGLQAVDGLTPSDYLVDAARRNIEGEITIDEVKQLLKSYYDWLRRALEYDLQQERDCDYKGLSKDEIIQHLSRFTAGLWEIHPFCEGNTRTTAVFLIQYLRSMGFDVNNDTFARHSWYFRNALVRANYSNPLKGVSRDYSFLEKFFRNLLLGENNELKNRYMVICPPEELASPDKLPDNQTDKLPDILPRNLGDKFETSNVNIIKLVKAIGENELSVKEMLMAVGLKDRENFMNNMLYPAINDGFVRMLHPESPRHPRQKYLLTVKGMGLYNKEKE